jgi:hypothetical protein
VPQLMSPAGLPHGSASSPADSCPGPGRGIDDCCRHQRHRGRPLGRRAWLQARPEIAAARAGPARRRAEVRNSMTGARSREHRRARRRAPRYGLRTHRWPAPPRAVRCPRPLRCAVDSPSDGRCGGREVSRADVDRARSQGPDQAGRGAFTRRDRDLRAGRCKPREHSGQGHPPSLGNVPSRTSSGEERDGTVTSAWWSRLLFGHCPRGRRPAANPPQQ